MTDNNKKAPKGVMEYFPLKEARRSQEIVLKEIDKVFKEGKKIVILEAPVGSGKSAIALTLARQAAATASKIPDKDGNVQLPVHIITPRKSLQDQYSIDFPDDLVTMKGRNAYPCIIDCKPSQYMPVLRAVGEGRLPPVLMSVSEMTCAEGPCKASPEVYKACTSDKACPYGLAMKTAQGHDTVVHNLHSFIYQTSFAEKFEKRNLLIIDEAHDIEGIVRDFATRKVTVHMEVNEQETKGFKFITEWVKFLMQPKFVPEETPADKSRKALDKNYKSFRDEYIERVNNLELKEETYKKGFSVEVNSVRDPRDNSVMRTVFEFVPHYVGGEVNKLLLDFGDQVLLMSGTIYDKTQYCAGLGIPSSAAHFIRIESTFPKENRPVYLKNEYQVDTSYAKWEENFPRMIEIVKRILEIFHDAKGLIHAPSYAAAADIQRALDDKRIWSHGPGDFLERLGNFFKSEGNGVFLSPICQQGVDFKEDRARFQIVLRVPNTSTNSAFVSDKLKSDYAWYNYQSLIVFGQQVGRVNRGPDDYGATFLVDARFRTFISKNRAKLPKWLQDGFIYK